MEESTLPESRHIGRLRPAIVASLILHLALVLALGRGALTLPRPTEADTTRTSVSVSITFDRPQRSEPTEAAVAPEPIAESSPDAAPAVTRVVSEPLPATDAAGDANAEPVLDTNRLRESISDAMVTYRRDVLDGQLRACQQYRERYDRWECPRGTEVKSATQELIDENMDTTFRAYTYGHDRNARISEALLADMDAMRPLMEDNSVLGTLARQRYDVMAVQYEVLNPGAVPRGVIPGLGAIGGPNTGGVVALASFGGSGIVILSGLMTLGFDGKIGVLGPTRAIPFDEQEECELSPSRQGQRAGGCW